MHTWRIQREMNTQIVFDKYIQYIFKNMQFYVQILWAGKRREHGF